MKANICLEDDLYNWLEEVRRKTDARSVPDVIRKIIATIHRATQTATTKQTLGILLDLLDDLDTEKINGFGDPDARRPTPTATKPNQTYTPITAPDRQWWKR